MFKNLVSNLAYNAIPDLSIQESSGRSIMILQRMISALENSGAAFHALLINVNEEDARWKPPSQNWSLLEIVCHLVDEEREDFRKRIELTLRDNTIAWPSINPELWAVDRRYNDQNFQAMVQALIDERKNSVQWLKSLEEPDWYATYSHPQLGEIRAGDLLVSWVAHDQLHLRQIAKRKYEMIDRDSGAFSYDYAGEW